MGTDVIVRQLLRSLCENTPWNYAALWKLDRSKRFQLKLEDGYFGNFVSDTAVESLHKDHYNGDLSFISLLPDSDAQYEHIMGHFVQHAVENITLPYSSGEGLVCKVAFSKKHQWVHASDHEKLFTHYSDEWKLQFAAGIKTILLVPVFTDGVLQLGSFNKVMDDPEIVHSITDLFNTFQDDYGTCYSLSTLTGLVPSQQLATRCPTTMDLCEVAKNNLAPPQSFSVFQNDRPISHSFELQEFGNDSRSHRGERIEISLCKDVMIGDHVMHHSCVNEESDLTSQTGDTGYTPNPKRSLPQPFSIFHNDHPISHSFEFQKFGNDPRSHRDERIENVLYKNAMIGDHVTDYSYVNEESDLTSQTGGTCYTSNPKESPTVVYFEKDQKITISNIHIETENCLYEDVAFMDVNYTENNSSLKFPANSELHKVLGICFPEESADFAWASSPPRASRLSNLRASHNIKDTGEQLSYTEPTTFVKNDKEIGDMLEAIVTSLPYDSGANVSEISPHNNTCSTLSGQFQNSCMTESNTVSDHFAESNLGRQAYDGFSSLVTNDFLTNPSQTSSKNISMFTTALSTKDATWSNMSTKQRCRNNVHKPRPRDRQLIQDRIKELRELVPDGSKCSIDDLLDRTVKHMLFLRGVSTRADKLRKCVQLEVKGRSLEPHPVSHTNGTSWVFQPGSQTETHPLVVEDLDHPGQLLVEMLCNDYAMFIEIAQVIRRLKITIVKGVLESKPENLRARFIIEVCRGFHRVDIVCPLMQLLQRNHCRIPNNL